MSQVISFQAALARASRPEKRYLLLGNGFSTALFHDIFSYRSLKEEADLSSKPELASAFEKLGTSDFEKVIRALEHSATVAGCYGAATEFIAKLKADAQALKSILVSTIASRHPENTAKVSDAQKASCSVFLGNFKKVYTLNYDVLLYWVLLSNREQRADDIDDGFRLPDGEFGVDYRVFDSPQSPTFFFMHGGLHIYDSGSETRKYVWNDTGRPIMAQVQAAIDQNLYPLFVAEGSSQQKMTKINHNGYLSKALRSFEEVCKIKDADLFIFGHGLNDTDEHILSRIRKCGIKRVFVSVYKGSAENYDTTFISKAMSLAGSRSSMRPLEVILFDAESAKVWSNVA